MGKRTFFEKNKKMPYLHKQFFFFCTNTYFNRRIKNFVFIITNKYVLTVIISTGKNCLKFLYMYEYC